METTLETSQEARHFSIGTNDNDIDNADTEMENLGSEPSLCSLEPTKDNKDTENNIESSAVTEDAEDIDLLDSSSNTKIEEETTIDNLENATKWENTFFIEMDNTKSHEASDDMENIEENENVGNKPNGENLDATENELVNPKQEALFLNTNKETNFETTTVNPKLEAQDENEEQESNFIFIAPDSVQVEMTGDQINPDQNGFSCNVCYDSFYTIDELAEHIKEHPHLPVQCNFCDKTFNKSHEFKRHSMAHTNARPYECEVCKQTFKLKQQFTKHYQKFHLSTHPVDRPYICDICQKGFTEKRHLTKHTNNVHLRTGTEFRCHVCQKGFKEKQNMKKHLRNAHSENVCDSRFECNLCHTTFKEKYNWKRHMKNTHKENVEDISYLTVTPNINLEEFVFEDSSEQDYEDTLQGFDPISLIQTNEENENVPAIQITPQTDNELTFSITEPTEENKADTDQIKPLSGKKIKRKNKKKESLPFIDSYMSIETNEGLPYQDPNFQITEPNSPVSRNVENQINNVNPKLEPSNSSDEERQNNLDYEKNTIVIPDGHFMSNVKQELNLKGEIGDATSPFNITEELGRLVTESNGLSGFVVNQERLKVQKAKKPRTPTEPEPEHIYDPFYPEKPYKCKDCGNNYAHKRSLFIHIKNHTGLKEFSCHICQGAFGTVTLLKKHLVSHNEERPHACDICGKTFKRVEDVTNHRKIHLGIRPFSCDVCEKTFRRNNDLTIHMRIHTGEKPYVCHICEKAFTVSSHLKRHMEYHSADELNGFISNTLKTLQEEEPLAGKRYLCEVCNKDFCTPAVLKRHYATHVEERLFTCEVCQKDFKRPSDLTAHMKIHSGIRPFICDVCQKDFRRNHDLTIHKRIHTGEKPYSCHLCGQSFTVTSHLNRHVKTHHSDEIIKD